MSADYNFQIAETGGAAARERLPEKMTVALGQVRSQPNATDQDTALLQAIGQVLDFALAGVDEECNVEVSVVKNTIATNGEEHTQVVLRRRPFRVTPPKVPAWSPTDGPLAVKPPADGSSAPAS